GTDHPILSSRASSAASLPPVRRPNHASRFEGIAKTNLQASTASDTETLQSQVNKAAKKRLSLSELEILHGRLSVALRPGEHQGWRRCRGISGRAGPGGGALRNTQQNGFQFGLDLQPDVKRFVIETKIDNPFGGTPSTEPVNYKNQGFYIGTGDQDNYLKIVAAANNGPGGIEVAGENAGAFSSTMYSADITGAALQTLDSITLRLTVDTTTGVATPDWTYTVGGSAINGAGTPVQLSGATLSALQGTYTVGGSPSALAVGIISTSYLSGQPFPAFWESIKITADGPTQPPSASVAGTRTGGS